MMREYKKISKSTSQNDDALNAQQILASQADNFQKVNFEKQKEIQKEN